MTLDIGSRREVPLTNKSGNRLTRKKKERTTSVNGLRSRLRTKIASLILLKCLTSIPRSEVRLISINLLKDTPD